MCFFKIRVLISLDDFLNVFLYPGYSFSFDEVNVVFDGKLGLLACKTRCMAYLRLEPGSICLLSSSAKSLRGIKVKIMINQSSLHIAASEAVFRILISFCADPDP